MNFSPNSYSNHQLFIHLRLDQTNEFHKYIARFVPRKHPLNGWTCQLNFIHIHYQGISYIKWLEFHKYIARFVPRKHVTSAMFFYGKRNNIFFNVILAKEIMTLKKFKSKLSPRVAFCVYLRILHTCGPVKL